MNGLWLSSAVVLAATVCVGCTAERGDATEQMVSERPAAVAVAPATVEEAPAAGKILIDHGRWSVVLSGQARTLRLRGGKAPVDVPPGRYSVSQYVEYARGDGGKSLTLSVPRGKSIVVEAGKTT